MTTGALHNEAGLAFPGRPLSVHAAQVAPPTRPAWEVGIEGTSSHGFHHSALTAAHQAGLSLRKVAEISDQRSSRTGSLPCSGRRTREGGSSLNPAGGAGGLGPQDPADRPGAPAARSADHRGLEGGVSAGCWARPVWIVARGFTGARTLLVATGAAASSTRLYVGEGTAGG